MQRSEIINELAAALAKAQAAIPPVKKDLSAVIETKAGGQYKYSYADLAACLDAIRKPLSDNGLAVIQTVETEPGSVAVETMLAHTSGQWVSHVIAFAASNDPRSTGSIITYGRRYGLSIAGVVTEADDDGATGHTGERLPERKPQAGSAPTCPVCKGAMWDNRGMPEKPKLNPKAPDYKCKNKECSGAIWPPKDAPAEPDGDLFSDDDLPPVEAAPATAAQVQIMGIWAQKVYGKDELESVFRPWLRENYGVDSRKALTTAQAAGVIAKLQAAADAAGK
jgi:hypothetical protein